MKRINEALKILIELNNSIENYVSKFNVYSTTYPFPLHDVHSEIQEVIALIRGEAMTKEIKGYRKLSEGETAKINAFKEDERALLNEINRSCELFDMDGRWKSIAITHFQQGFMALTRAIAKPDE